MSVLVAKLALSPPLPLLFLSSPESLSPLLSAVNRQPRTPHQRLIVAAAGAIALRATRCYGSSGLSIYLRWRWGSAVTGGPGAARFRKSRRVHRLRPIDLSLKRHKHTYASSPSPTVAFPVASRQKLSIIDRRLSSTSAFPVLSSQKESLRRRYKFI